MAEEKRCGFFVIFIRLTTLLWLFFGIWAGIGFILGNSSLLYVTSPGPSNVSGRKIVIDAGHGGRDPGAIGRTGLQEKEVNLDIAKRLKRLFSRVGVTVVMIREQDIDYGGAGALKAATVSEESEGVSLGITHKRRDLIYRAKKTNESKADLLLSIHVNSFPQSIWSGAQCFYDLNNPRSKTVAERLQEQLAQDLGPNRRKALPADYMILKATNIPSVTVEVGFLSNPREEKLLATPDYREMLAQAIFKGTLNYLAGDGGKETAPVGAELGKVYPQMPPAPLAPGTVRLFFTAPYSEDLELWVEERDLGFTGQETQTAKARRLIAELLRGPGENSALLPCLPSGDWFKNLSIQGKRAVIDLYDELPPAVNGGMASELLALYSLVNTIGLNLEVEELTILFEGKEGCSLGGHIILDEPITPRTDLVHQTR